MIVSVSSSGTPLNYIQNVEHDMMVAPLEEKLSFSKKFKIYFEEFCEVTGIHGFKFLGERGRTFMEKLWWLIGIICSLYGCALLITKTYQKWITSPVIVSLDNSQTLIANIPFPAITICSDVIAKRNLFNYSDVEEKINSVTYVSEKEREEYNFMNMICENAAKFEDPTARFTNESALHFITKVVPSMNETVKQIRWKGNKYYEPECFLTPTFTSNGVCYTFNILDRTDIFSNEV